MKFQKLLLEAGKALQQEEVRALFFLCAGLLGRNHVEVGASAGDLFSRLMDQDHLSEERPHLLTELLSIIHRTRLVRDLGLSCYAATNLISSYRKLLYCLSEELTDEDFRSMKFLLSNKLPRKKLDDNSTTLEVFVALEAIDLIRETNLDFLEEIIQTVCPMLVEKIRQFKAENTTENQGLIAQETAQSIYPQQSTQVPFNPLASAAEAETMERMSGLGLVSFSTSSDPTSTFHEDDHEARSPQLSETASRASVRGNLSAFSPVGSDAVAGLPNDHTSSGTPTSATSSANHLETYPMTAAKRGLCLIINNHKFGKSGLNDRDGTMFDEERLYCVFSWLGFEVQIERDRKSHEMLSLMEALAANSQRDCDCVVCCVLSHGLEGSVFGVDGNTVDIRTMMEEFSGKKCPALIGKPKLFFVQACQGRKNQEAVYLESDDSAYGSVDSDAVSTKDCIPSHADLLLGLATVPLHVSYREKENGTWFIQSLCHNLVEMVPRGLDLLSILTKVNADVSVMSDAKRVKKQMPQPAFTLTKKLVFPAPEDSPVFFTTR